MTTSNSNNTTTTGVHSQHVLIGDYQLCVHQWPVKEPVQAVVLIFHGFLAHGLYPTVRNAAKVISSHHPHIRVLSYDMQGHGRSEGFRGYLPSAAIVWQEATAVTQYIHTNYCTKQEKFFLLGSSMGGAIALAVSSSPVLSFQVDGIVLLAPMLQLSVSSLEQVCLQGLATILPTLACIPSSSTSAALQYRDPIQRQECEQDPLVVVGTMIRVGSAHTCVQLTRIVSELPPMTTSLLIMLADEDVIDKTLQRYPALHGLLCESRPLLDQIQQDLVDWIQARL